MGKIILFISIIFLLGAKSQAPDIRGDDILKFCDRWDKKVENILDKHLPEIKILKTPSDFFRVIRRFQSTYMKELNKLREDNLKTHSILSEKIKFEQMLSTREKALIAGLFDSYEKVLQDMEEKKYKK